MIISDGTTFTVLNMQTDYDQNRLEHLLGGPDLLPLRQRLRRRFEQGRCSDTFTLSSLRAVERHALEGLLGRRARQAGSMMLSISGIDEALVRACLAPSLRDALELLDGPIREVAAAKMALAARWQALFERQTGTPLESILDANGRGLVKRLSGADPGKAAAMLDDALRVIQHLPQHGQPLAHLAASVLGDAHALDDGRPVATLVLAVFGRGQEDERPRERWARHGLLVNELAAPALALNLPAKSDTSGGRLVTEARALGEPLHLSLRQLLRTPPRWTVTGRQVFVCENPTVVAIAADRLGPACPPLVCTDGMPSAAQRTLLVQLLQAGGELMYHGDYDWPGIGIGNFVMGRLGAKPWRFSAGDYDGQRGRMLEGAPVAACWDSELSAKMLVSGRAVEEELVVDVLLEDLKRMADG